MNSIAAFYFERTVATYSAARMKDIVDKGNKEREMERKGRKDAPRSHRECMQLALFPCDVYARRSLSLLEITSPDANGNVSEGLRSLIALNC